MNREFKCQTTAATTSPVGLGFSPSICKTARAIYLLATSTACVPLPPRLSVPEGDSDFSARWRDFKKTFSRNIELRHVWQPRFWEHTIRNEQDYRRHMDYVYINPLKHGYVGKVVDWPYSTFHRDVREGLYPADWAGEIEDFAAGERK